MAESLIRRLSRYFSTLTGRTVAFSSEPPSGHPRGPQVYGIYKVAPAGLPMIVRADLALLGSFAGTLVGLPDAEVVRHLAADPMEELMRDAIYEVLNIAGSVIMSERHTVLSKMTSEPLEIPSAAIAVLKSPDERSDFSVTIDGYQGGRFAVFY